VLTDTSVPAGGSMFRIPRMPVAALIAALVIGGSSLSAAPAAKPRAHSIVGTLQKVDGQTLTVQTAKGTEVVTLAPTASIHHGSSKIAASDLSNQTGTRVKVRYMEANGQKQAESVTVSTAKTAAKHKKA
jgi:hypothetical protein